MKSDPTCTRSCTHPLDSFVFFFTTNAYELFAVFFSIMIIIATNFPYNLTFILYCQPYKKEFSVTTLYGPLKGYHGYDPKYSDMRGIFVATGPGNYKYTTQVYHWYRKQSPYNNFHSTIIIFAEVINISQVYLYKADLISRKP